MSQNEWTTTEIRAWQSWPTSRPFPAQVFASVLARRHTAGVGLGVFGARGEAPSGDARYDADARGPRSGAACAVDALLADPLHDDDAARMPRALLDYHASDDDLLDAPRPATEADVAGTRALLEGAAARAAGGAGSESRL